MSSIKFSACVLFWSRRSAPNQNLGQPGNVLELPWNSKLLFADRISALSRFDFSGKDFKGGIDCTAPTRELGVISGAARPAREGKRQLGTNLGIDEGRHGRQGTDSIHSAGAKAVTKVNNVIIPTNTLMKLHKECMDMDGLHVASINKKKVM